MTLQEAEARLWSRLGVEPQEHRLRLPGLGTTVRLLEVGQGDPVLFLHGTSVAAPSWSDLAARLDRYRCLLLDRPGCGASDPLPERLDVADVPTFATRLVSEVLDGLQLGSAHLVATSLGGHLAVRAAGGCPDRVRRLVLLGWTLGMPGSVAPAWLRLGSAPGLARMAGRMPVTPRSVRMTLRQFGMRRAVDEGHLSPEALAWLVALYRETDTMRHESLDGPRFVTMRGWDERARLDRDALDAVRAPTLVIWGEEDPFADVRAARELVDHLPDARLQVVPAAGHAPWLDAPDEVVGGVDEFLAA